MVDLRGIHRDKLDSAIDKIGKYDVFIHWLFKTNAAMDHFKIAEKLKNRFPKSVHVAGGVHVEVQPEECARKFDVIVIGPGEESFVKVIKDIKSGNLKKIYRQKWSEVSFCDTPFPRREFLPVDHVVTRDQFPGEYGDLLSTTMYTNRGCPYGCAYCTLNIPRALQTRSPKIIRAELKYLKENYSLEAVLPKDEVAIHPNPKVSSEVFAAYRDYDLIWRGQTTVAASYEQLKDAYNSGCRELAVGIETVDPKVMEIINKKWQTPKKISDFLSNAKKVGIKIKTCFILGLPGEPMDILDKTMKFIVDNEIDYVNVSGFCPLPGSPIYNDYKYYGIKYVDKDWNKHANLLYRYSDEEEVGLPFEYEKENRWGKTFSRDQIAGNIRQIQRWLRSNGLSY